VTRAVAVAPVIAVDGPGGTGKGTLCAALARTLGWGLLDSGALYRALAAAALQAGVALEDATAVAALARSVALEFRPHDGGVQVLLDGRDISDALRSEACGTAASRIAALPEVRRELLTRQRALRRAPGLVADGRDMGTVVFPDAALKIFLTASPEERARRRYKQLKEKGLNVNLAELSREIADRDRRDSVRLVAPLRPAADAVVLDTTPLSAAQVFERVLELARERGLTSD